MSHPTNFCHQLSESWGNVDPVYFITAAFQTAAYGIDFLPAAECS